jgi:hypothetical protein
MNYGGLGFLAASTHPLSLLPPGSFLSSQSSCVSAVELTDGRGGR